MPTGLSICSDCMQKSFDSFNSGFGGGNGIQFLDLSNMDFNNLKDMNLGELLSGNLSNQKPKTKKAKKKKKKNKKRTVVPTAIITIILQHRQKGMKTAPIPEVRPVRESSLRNIV